MSNSLLDADFIRKIKREVDRDKVEPIFEEVTDVLLLFSDLNLEESVKKAKEDNKAPRTIEKNLKLVSDLGTSFYEELKKNKYGEAFEKMFEGETISSGAGEVSFVEWEDIVSSWTSSISLDSTIKNAMKDITEPEKGGATKTAVSFFVYDMARLLWVYSYFPPPFRRVKDILVDFWGVNIPVKIGPSFFEIKSTFAWDDYTRVINYIPFCKLNFYLSFMGEEIGHALRYFALGGMSPTSKGRMATEYIGGISGLYVLEKLGGREAFEKSFQRRMSKVGARFYEKNQEEFIEYWKKFKSKIEGSIERFLDKAEKSGALKRKLDKVDRDMFSDFLKRDPGQRRELILEFISKSIAAKKLAYDKNLEELLAMIWAEFPKNLTTYLLTKNVSGKEPFFHIFLDFDKWLKLEENYEHTTYKEAALSYQTLKKFNTKRRKELIQARSEEILERVSRLILEY